MPSSHHRQESSHASKQQGQETGNVNVRPHKATQCVWCVCSLSSATNGMWRRGKRERARHRIFSHGNTTGCLTCFLSHHTRLSLPQGSHGSLSIIRRHAAQLSEEREGGEIGCLPCPATYNTLVTHTHTRGKKESLEDTMHGKQSIHILLKSHRAQCQATSRIYDVT